MVAPAAGEPAVHALQKKTSKWTNATHLGTEYAVLLVEAGFHPPAILDKLPERGAEIAAVTSAPGAAKPPSPILRFGGYEWRVRDVPSSRGNFNYYDSANAWVDEVGALHLRIAKGAKGWTCAEISMTSSLGYGTYEYTVRDTSHLDPAAVFGMFTYDYAGGALNNREMDIEITRFGDPSNKNAGYTVQPYYVATKCRTIQGSGRQADSFPDMAGRPGNVSDGASGKRRIPRHCDCRTYLHLRDSHAGHRIGSHQSVLLCARQAAPERSRGGRG
jgi:hypothetical protein